MQTLSERKKPPIVIPDHETLAFVGEGSYGEVWLAKNSLGAFRAVKIVSRSRFQSSKPFEREFQGIQKAEPVSRSHDGIIGILHVGTREAEGCFFYVMEAADDLSNGQAIDPSSYRPKMLSSLLAPGAPLDFSFCLNLALSLTAGLAHFHQNGLVHRDVKSSNIIFVNGRPKLADIGLVSGIGPANSYVGTEGYIPPEGPGSERADIFSLGKVLYEAAFAQPVQSFPELPELVHSSPCRTELLELNEIILKACHPDANKRYGSALEMHRDVIALKEGKSIRKLNRNRQRIAAAKRIAWVASPTAAIVALGFWQFDRSARLEDEVKEVKSELNMRRNASFAFLPQVKFQPVNAEANVGCPVRFSVTAAGNGPIRYQWFHDATPLQGATNANLIISSVTLRDQGAYSVQLENPAGKTRSSDAALVINTTRIVPSAFDLWDINEGARILKASGFLPIGTPSGMFGQNGQAVMDEDSYSYFVDGAPDGFIHFVEWGTPRPVTVSAIRLFAVGDGAETGNAREFAEFVLKTKSPGSTSFDVTLLRFTPSHPYAILDDSTWAVLDLEIPAVTAQTFRAEFLQFSAHPGFDGPRIMELDAFATVPEVRPAFLAQPESLTVKENESAHFSARCRGGALHYLWLHNGSPLPHATNSFLSIPEVHAVDAGVYTLVVSNTVGSVSSNPVELRRLN